MGMFAFEHCQTEIEKFRPSWQDAKSYPETCPACGLPMKLIEVYRVAFTEFKPFRTSSFSNDGQEIEVRDRGQLRSLLRQHKMVERGDSTNYFGSDPKSVPTFDEITRFGKGGISEKTKKMLKAGLVGAVDAKEWGALREEDKKTDSGRKSKPKMTERDRKTLYELRNKGGVQLAGG